MTKQARLLEDRRIKQCIDACKNERELAMLLLSIKAGLRAVEIAGLKWTQVDFGDSLLLLKTTKGDKPRNVPMAKDLIEALQAYRASLTSKREHVFVNRHSRPGQPLTGNAITQWFHHFYNKRLGWTDYSSHSGRRTFATKAARNLGHAGASMKDLQKLMGHEWLSTTQRYIEESEDAQRKIVDLQ